VTEGCTDDSADGRAIGLSDLATDWGGFEKLIAKLHETGEVTVEHNVILAGRSRR
jgi:hypothetical protein